ncbi:hypothetical protein EK904_010292 [Melospiza melodia maxima]|nr:hypothetical protein EK904_010292 [Melospiza melodia maxima]
MASSAQGLPSAELWASHNKMVMEPLDTNDPEVHSIIKKEKQRQRLGLELIASENFASRAVLEALGSCMNNKYSEGYPGQRYGAGLRPTNPTPGRPPKSDPGLPLSTGIAVALHQAMTPEFKAYQQQVVANCKALSSALMEMGYDIVTGGSDNHLILVDLRSKGTDGGRAERVLELCSIACNKNTCPGDVSALRPSGLRFGTPALTSRGFRQDDFRKVAQYIHKGIELALRVQKDMSPKATLKEFKDKLEDPKYRGELKALKEEVEAFAATFPLPGLPVL